MIEGGEAEAIQMSKKKAPEVDRQEIGEIEELKLKDFGSRLRKLERATIGSNPIERGKGIQK